MKLYKTTAGIVVEADNQWVRLKTTDWDTLLNQPGLYQTLRQFVQQTAPDDTAQQAIETGLLAPIGSQEVWAAGVTYLRSRDARIEESKQVAGGTDGGSFYDRVYDADRPELFFKATPNRVVGPGGTVRIRPDSSWNVPEPELTLFINQAGQIVGYTCGNDMSSRSIEGENPLYLPQAKTYDGSAAIGPCVLLTPEPISAETEIHLAILRAKETAFSGSIAISQMKRSHDELASWLFRACSFSTGCFLMTGTGLVPPNDFTLTSGDVVSITIDGIGTLTNTVG
jgi:2-dehydro-3-deoxy-D-arabinonate dehydratase